jgi:hypothetical protein
MTADGVKLSAVRRLLMTAIYTLAPNELNTGFIQTLKKAFAGETLQIRVRTTNSAKLRSREELEKAVANYEAGAKPAWVGTMGDLETLFPEIK